MMKRKKVTTIATILLVGIFLACTVGMASAHFTMLFPGKDMDVTPKDYIAEVGDTKTIWIIWGHPYEHILFNMTSVPEVGVRDPKGAVTALTPTEITVGGKKAYQVAFTVDKIGDWIVYAKYEDEDEKLIDYVKAIIHCGEEAWFGWDAKLGQKAEIVPFTRPYGLEEGFVFTGKALYDGSALPDADVEIEMYHTKAVGEEVVEEAEKMFPYDPPMMFTRVTKTDKNGGFAYTLDEPGIWFVGAYGPEVGGLTQRSVFIIPVLDAFPPKAVVEVEEVEVTVPAELGDLKSSIAELKSSIEGLKSRVKSLEDKSEASKPSTGAPGFGAIAAIAGLLIVVYLVKRRKR